MSKPKEVEIVWFNATDESTDEAKVRIAELLNDGWVIAVAGGAGYGMVATREAFIVLVRG